MLNVNKSKLSTSNSNSSLIPSSILCNLVINNEVYCKKKAESCTHHLSSTNMRSSTVGKHVENMVEKNNNSEKIVKKIETPKFIISEFSDEKDEKEKYLNLYPCNTAKAKSSLYDEKSEKNFFNISSLPKSREKEKVDHTPKQFKTTTD